MEPTLNINIRDEDHITVTNNKKASLKMYFILLLTKTSHTNKVC